MATAKATTNHDEIRKWVEARKGRPARVKATGRGKDPGILRIDFPGFSGEDTLEEIEWDEFFEWFDRNGLALLLSSERGNRFNKLVQRSNASGSKKSASSKKSSSAKKASSSSSKSSAKKSSAGSKSSAKKSSSSASTKKAASKKSSPSTKSAGSKKSSSTKSAPAKKSASSSKKASSSKTSARKASSSKKSAAKSPAKKATTSSKKAAAPRRAVAASPSRKSAGASKKSSSKKATSSKKSSGGSSKTTTNHDEIRNWVEARGGFPATVAGTESRGEEAGLLRIDYPGFSGEGTLERIEWDDWFDKFDEENLAFLYQDKKNSRFSKLVRR